MSDNSFGTTFGPSAPGAINLVSGNTGGVDKTTRRRVPRRGNPCLTATVRHVADRRRRSRTTTTARPATPSGSAAQNVGDLLNAAGLSWGFFQGGFRPTVPRHGSRPPTRRHARRPVGVRQRAGRVRRHAQRGRRPRRHRRPGRPARPRLRHQGRLHPAPRAVPVLRVHREPAPPRAGLAQPPSAPTRPPPASSTPPTTSTTCATSTGWSAIANGTLSPDHLPARELPQGPRPTRTATPAYSDPLDEQQFVVKRDQRAGADARLVEHGRRHRLRRLRRLVRPRVQRGAQPVATGRRRPDRTPDAAVRHRHASLGGQHGPLRLRAPPAAARHLALRQGQLHRPHHSPTSRRSSSSSRTTGAWAASPGPSTARPGRWPTCSTSGRRPGQPSRWIRRRGR